MAKKIFAVHPGEILREEFMKPLGLSSNQLAKALHISVPRVNDIVLERRAITADTAVRLARYFGGDAQTWMNLQSTYDIVQARRKMDVSSIKPRSDSEVRSA
jgi:addiction module HigA family antidote